MKPADAFAALDVAIEALVRDAPARHTAQMQTARWACVQRHVVRFPFTPDEIALATQDLKAIGGRDCACGARMVIEIRPVYSPGVEPVCSICGQPRQRTGSGGSADLPPLVMYRGWVLPVCDPCELGTLGDEFVERAVEIKRQTAMLCENCWAPMGEHQGGLCAGRKGGRLSLPRGGVFIDYTGAMQRTPEQEAAMLIRWAEAREAQGKPGAYFRAQASELIALHTTPL